jgi:hypothetical protein
MGSYLSGETTQWVPDSSILKLRIIEQSIQQEEFQHAKTLLDNYNPQFYVEKDFKSVYSAWVDYKLQSFWDTLGGYNLSYDTFWVDSENFIIDSTVTDSQSFIFRESSLQDSIVQLLEVIASKDGVKISPASYSARSILFAHRQLEFFDAPMPVYPSIQGVLLGSCVDSIALSYPVKLFNEFDSFTGIEGSFTDSGRFYLDGYRLNELDSNIQYYLKFNVTDTSYITSATASLLTLIYNTTHVYDCDNGIPNLKSVRFKNDNYMIQAQPNPSIDDLYLQYMPGLWKLQVTDNSGKVYYTLEGQNDVQLDMRHLLPGMYLVQVENSKTGKIQTLRIAKI